MAAITLAEATARYHKELESYQTLGAFDQCRMGHVRAHMERLIANAQRETTNPMSGSYYNGYANGIRAVLNNLSNIPNEQVVQ